MKYIKLRNSNNYKHELRGEAVIKIIRYKNYVQLKMKNVCMSLCTVCMSNTTNWSLI